MIVLHAVLLGGTDEQVVVQGLHTGIVKLDIALLVAFAHDVQGFVLDIFQRSPVSSDSRMPQLRNRVMMAKSRSAWGPSTAFKRLRASSRVR